MSEDKVMTTADILRRDGIARMETLSPVQLGHVMSHLMANEVANAHVWAKRNQPPQLLPEALARHEWPAMCHTMECIVTAPHFFARALKTYQIAKDYFGEEPLLYSMNAFWTQPVHNGQVYHDTHGWHRDGDDRKQLVLFMYGTNVFDMSNGGHQYQRASQHSADGNLGYSHGAPPADVVIDMLGMAGTMFMEDTSGLHMGHRPNQPRCITWARWGVTDVPDSYKWDQLSPVDKAKVKDYPTDTALQHAVRLVVR